MAIQAKTIIQRVVDTLQDTTSIRWPVAELVRYLNDGQREIVLHRPDAFTISQSLTLIAGTRQTLPANGAKLLDVVRNTSGAAIRMINREILDAQTPGWHSLTGSTNILHFMFDAREPRVFYVYPPATNQAKVDITYTAYPTDIAEPAAGTQHANVVGNISLPDIYGNALQDFILYKAYTKDSEYAGNAQRAQAHYAAFANALGLEIKATVAVAPNPIGNPNMPHRNTAI